MHDCALLTEILRGWQAAGEEWNDTAYHSIEMQNIEPLGQLTRSLQEKHQEIRDFLAAADRRLEDTAF